MYIKIFFIFLILLQFKYWLIVVMKVFFIFFLFENSLYTIQIIKTYFFNTNNYILILEKPNFSKKNITIFDLFYILIKISAFTTISIIINNIKQRSKYNTFTYIKLWIVKFFPLLFCSILLNIPVRFLKFFIFWVKHPHSQNIIYNYYKSTINDVKIDKIIVKRKKIAIIKQI
jgi:hypothetical protein